MATSAEIIAERKESFILTEQSALEKAAGFTLRKQEFLDKDVILEIDQNARLTEKAPFENERVSITGETVDTPLNSSVIDLGAEVPTSGSLFPDPLQFSPDNIADHGNAGNTSFPSSGRTITESTWILIDAFDSKDKTQNLIGGSSPGAGIVDLVPVSAGATIIPITGHSLVNGEFYRIEDTFFLIIDANNANQIIIDTPLVSSLVGEEVVITTFGSFTDGELSSGSAIDPDRQGELSRLLTEYNNANTQLTTSVNDQKSDIDLESSTPEGDQMKLDIDTFLAQIPTIPLTNTKLTQYLIDIIAFETREATRVTELETKLETFRIPLFELVLFRIHKEQGTKKKANLQGVGETNNIDFAGRLNDLINF